jgi:transcriptional regulator with XRE-family HTH domain
MDLARVGRGVRALRRRKRWRQGDLAAAAGSSRTVVGRIERGESSTVAIGVIDNVVAAVGGSLDVLLRWQGEGLDRLLDEAHAGIVDQLVAWLRAHGWEVAVEASFSRYGERGSIDVLAWHPVQRALAVFEVKSVTPDMQAMLVGLDRKARLGPTIAHERGWDPVTVARFLVLADTSTNRRRLARFGAMIEAALPAGTREVRAWLEDPQGRGIAGVWFLAKDRGAARTGGDRSRVRPSSTGIRRDAEPGSPK